MIAKYKPTLIAESFSRASDEEKMELYEVIASRGYELFGFEDFNVKEKMFRLNDKRDLTKWKTTLNIYAVQID